jgi:hypothetical protein
MLRDTDLHLPNMGRIDLAASRAGRSWTDHGTARAGTTEPGGEGEDDSEQAS